MKAKTVAINIGGRKRTLRFDLNAIAHYEGERGEGSLQYLRLDSVTALRTLIWACLLAHDEDPESEGGNFTDEELPKAQLWVGKWLSEEDALSGIYEDVVGLVEANSPEKAEAGEGDEGPPDPPTDEGGSDEPTPSPSSSSESASATSGG